MTCKALTNNDGSWYCASCQIGGDRDEPVEEFCRAMVIGVDLAKPGSERTGYGDGDCGDKECPEYGSPHSHPASTR